MAIEVRAKGAVSDINVTPLVDVMLVLLIIFMVITPMLQKTYSVDMAKAEFPRTMQDADKDDAVVIAVTRDGKLFLGSTAIQPADVTTKVKDATSGRTGSTVFIKSDRRAKYGDVVKVVDDVRAAGIEQLGLLTEKLERAEPLPGGAPGGN